MKSFKQLSKNFDCFLFDQWGVIHDGKKKFNFVNKSFKFLKNKYCILISNTSQNKEETVRDILNKLKINYNFFNRIVTSGEILENSIFSQEKKLNNIKKYLKLKKCYLFSNSKKSKVVKNLGLKECKVNNAKFILAMSIKPTNNIEKYKTVLNKLFKKKLVMICSNPDQHVFDGKVNKFVLQVGSLASYYQALGGKVIYVGKPSSEIFNFALRKLRFKKKRILMIGDSIKTDIKGASSIGIKSALTLEGFNANEKKFYKNLNLKQIIKKIKIKPDYIIKNISV